MSEEQQNGPRAVPLSVLDLAPVGTGYTPSEALRASIRLAQRTEELGYHRFWLAEHHNMPGIASSAPAVMIGQVAAATSRLRVGSGGVMLPNHAPLVVAEQFGTLDALFPGRIDLGLGRAPGTDQITAHALRRSTRAVQSDDFLSYFTELRSFLAGDFADDHPYASVTATPGIGADPAIWLLGSSGYSAQVAGHLGLPFAFAHHFSARNTMPALELYRSTFRPSEVLDEPRAMLTVAVVCAETDDRADWLAGSGRLSFVRLRSGRPGTFPSPEESAATPLSDLDRAVVAQWTEGNIVGSQEKVVAELTALRDRTGADELMVSTLTHAPEDRLRSYELLAEAMPFVHADEVVAASA